MVISVIQLGTVDYSTALRLQQRLVELRKNDEIGNVLLLLEHAPVITLGRNARRDNVLAGDELLKQRGVELFECDRGGDVTFHGPGQLVGYPIFDLRSFLGSDGRRKTLGAVEYVRRLEEALIRTCADYGITTERAAGLTGVWTQIATSEGALSADPVRAASAGSRKWSNAKAQAKIAAIGVHISRSVTSHGFALNVNTDLGFFDLIIPCGISGKPVTSLERVLEDAVPLDEVAQAVARNFGRVFNSQIVWVESLDALLGRKVGVPVRKPEELRKITGEEEKFWV